MGKETIGTKMTTVLTEGQNELKILISVRKNIPLSVDLYLCILYLCIFQNKSCNFT